MLLKEVILLILLGTITNGRRYRTADEEKVCPYDQMHPETIALTTGIRGRITGGVPATEEQGPFVVSFHWVSINCHVCGGSLIGKKTVITAAHCCTNIPEERPITEWVIKYDGLRRKELKQTNRIANVIIFPGFTPTEHSGDYCLLHLEDEVIMSDTVKMIRISDEFPILGDIAATMGWGITDSWNITASHYLKYVEQTITPMENCDVRPWPLTKYHICGVSEYGAPCTLDSGGPLVFNKKLIGMVSYSPHGQCGKGYEHVFSYLAPDDVLTWIEENRI